MFTAPWCDLIAPSQQISVLTMDNFEFLSTGDNANEILEQNPTSYTAAVIFDGISWGDESLPENNSYTIRYPIITARSEK